MAKTKSKNESNTRKLTWVGKRGYIANRYPGSNKVKLPVAERLYYDEDGKSLVIPSLNIMSFLAATKTNSCVRLLTSGRGMARLSHFINSFVSIEPYLIPMTRNGKQIVFKGMGNNGIHEFHASPVLDGGKRPDEPPVRVMIDLPWELEFDVTIHPNNQGIDWILIGNFFEEGGYAVGLGSFRSVFGKGLVTIS